MASRLTLGHQYFSVGDNELGEATQRNHKWKKLTLANLEWLFGEKTGQRRRVRTYWVVYVEYIKLELMGMAWVYDLSYSKSKPLTSSYVFQIIKPILRLLYGQTIAKNTRKGYSIIHEEID